MYTGLIINGTIPRGDVWNLFPPQELDPPMGEGCTMLHLYSSGQGPENTRFWGENRILRAEANLKPKKHALCGLFEMPRADRYKWSCGAPINGRWGFPEPINSVYCQMLMLISFPEKKHAEPEKGYISGIYSPPMNASHQKRTTLQNFSGPGIQKK